MVTIANPMKIITHLILAIAIVWTSYAFYSKFYPFAQHFSEEAERFIQFQSNIVDNISGYDLVAYKGKYYWPLGPFPAIVLMPFKLVYGQSFHQGHMQFILIVLLTYFLYRLAQIHNFNNTDSFYLAAAFLLGSFVIGLIVEPNSWFYAQIVALLFFVALLYEYKTRCRPWLLGILTGILVACRPFTVLVLVFLITHFLTRTQGMKQKIFKMIMLLTPVLISILLLGWFNYSRFGNFFETGYGLSKLDPYYADGRKLGFFSWQHIPTNIYWYFIISLVPLTSGSYHLVYPFVTYEQGGLSLFICSPFFIYSLRTLKKRVEDSRVLWVTVGLILLLLLSYFGTGWIQFGPRYAGDFFPIIYLLTLYSFAHPKLHFKHRLLIALSCLFNAFLIWTHM